MWFIYALLGALSGSGATILLKILLQHYNAWFIATIHITIMTFIMWILVMAGHITGHMRYMFEECVRTANWPLILMTGLFGAGSHLFHLLALAQAPVQWVIALDRLSIVFVVILSMIVLHEPHTWKAFLGALCMFGGAVLLVKG